MARISVIHKLGRITHWSADKRLHTPEFIPLTGDKYLCYKLTIQDDRTSRITWLCSNPAPNPWRMPGSMKEENHNG